jgi:hypothetical protein
MRRWNVLLKQPGRIRTIAPSLTSWNINGPRPISVASFQNGDEMVPKIPVQDRKVVCTQSTHPTSADLFAKLLKKLLETV